jgi:hypothetical protein
MKKMHVTDLTDGELSAVFRAAAREAVERAKAASLPVPSFDWASAKAVEALAAHEPVKPARRARKKAVA